MSQTEKSMENRFRRTLDRAGYSLHKGVCCVGRRGYIICDKSSGLVLAGTSSGLQFDLSLEDVQEWIKENI